MTVIIRLQNLPWTANALDIRRFFQGLSIPDGGVHIVGGEKGDAFIAFNTDDDARQAMYRDNSRISDSPVKLMLSSKSEMQNVIAVARGAAQGNTNTPQRPNQTSAPGGPQMGPQGGMAPGMKSGSSGSNIGANQPQLGSYGGELNRDGRPGDIGGFNNQSQSQFDGHSDPDRMGGFNERMGGPDQMGVTDRMGSGPDRMGSGPDRMGSGPDRMGSGPDRMGSGPDRMGSGPDRMVVGPDRMGGGPDRMGGGPDRMGGGPERLGGGPERMGGGPDRLGGGPDRMGGGPDRLGGGPDRLGGGPDRMGGGPDRLGGGPDRMSTTFDRMGGGSNRMGSSGPDRMIGGSDRMIMEPDRISGYDRIGGGNRDRKMDMGEMDMGGRIGGSGSMHDSEQVGSNSDRMGGGSRLGGNDFMGGGGFDRMDVPDQMGGMNRVGGNINIDSNFDRFGGPDNMGRSRLDDNGEHGGSGRGDMLSGQNQFGDHDRQDRFRESDFNLDRRGGFGRINRDMEDRPMGGGFGQDRDNWSRRNDNNRIDDNNFIGGDRDRRGDSARGFGGDNFREADNFGRGDQMDMDQDNRGGFNSDMPPQDNFNRGGFNRDDMRDDFNRGGMRDNFNQDGFNRDESFAPGQNQLFGGDFGGNRMESSNSGFNDMNRHQGHSDFDRGSFSRSSMRDRMSPERGFRSGRGGFSSIGGFHGEGSRKRGQELNVHVVVSNMPTTINYKDVRRFFSGMEIPREGLKLINDKYGERIGEAYVMFAKEPDCHEAVKKSGYMLGHKKVTVRKCSAHDFEAAVDSYVPRGVRPAPSGGPTFTKRNRSRSPISKSHPDSNCVILKNLHFKGHKDDIRKFLGHLKLKHNGPIMDTNLDGRPSGNAYVEFESKKDQQEALNLHKKILMGRTVEIYSIGKNEYNSKTKSSESKDVGDKRLVEIKSEKDEKDGKDKDKSGKSECNSKDDERKYYCVRMRGLPFSTTPETIKDFFSGMEIVNRGIHIVYTRQRQAAGIAFVEFVTSTDCKKAIAKDKEYIGKRYIDIAPVAKKDMMEELAQEQQRQNGGQSSGPIKYSGDTLTMSNLPFKVQLEDIMEFFTGFRAIQDSVRLRYSKDGKPMGDAMVSFSNPHEAQRATKELNRKMMLGRPIFLSPSIAK